MCPLFRGNITLNGSLVMSTSVSVPDIPYLAKLGFTRNGLLVATGPTGAYSPFSYSFVDSFEH